MHDVHIVELPEMFVFSSAFDTYRAFCIQSVVEQARDVAAEQSPPFRPAVRALHFRR